MSDLWSSPRDLAGLSGEVVPGAGRGSAMAWGVAALLRAVSDHLATRFASVAVRGELSGFSRAASGHCYFSLKDAEGAPGLLRCAMFRRAAQSVTFDPADGQQVELRGRLSLYEPRGELQMVVEHMARVGTGALYEEFLKRKARLEAEGLFDAERKRALPGMPRALGVVTSLGAAALHDVITALRRRAPHVRVVVYPSVVQGPEAPAALMAALQQAWARAEVEALLLVRGGGSLEDLWAFNDERLVRAVSRSPLPIICGVGHETDVTLCDLVADLRAPTPTAAAELAIASRPDTLAQLWGMRQQLLSCLHQSLDRAHQRVDRLTHRAGHPAALLKVQTQRLRSNSQRLQRGLIVSSERREQLLKSYQSRGSRALHFALQTEARRLDAVGQRLSMAHPQRVLQRGYAWLEDTQGSALNSVQSLATGQSMVAVLADGRVQAQVQEVIPNPP